MAKVRSGKIMLFLTTIFLLYINIGVVGGSRSMEIKRLLKRINKPAVKTFKIEGGDIVDCVDIYQQPAFDHPLLKNHTIEMRPSDFTEEAEKKAASTVIPQTWQQSGTCPEGTIPIRRIRKIDLLRASSLNGYGMKDGSPNQWEQALLVTQLGTYYGASASLTVWGMHVEPQEISKTSVVVGDNPPAYDNAIEAGWMVSKKVYGDDRSRFFTHWTIDPSSDCYDHRCPGFVQTNSQVVLGAPFAPLSTADDPHFITISILKDNSKNVWWLLYGDTPVGYWPVSIFKSMNFAAVVNWGGSVQNTAPSGSSHTRTQMGNGIYANDRLAVAAQVNNILYLGDDNQFHPPPYETEFYVSKPRCYDMMELGMGSGDTPGYNFLYGGSAQDPLCV